MGGVAENEYVGAKTSVWWDIENCAVPRDCDPYAIAQNISSALVKLNYRGALSSLNAYGDTLRIPTSVQQALNSTGISLNHVPAGVKDASDKKILVDMLFWAIDNPPPANYLLISGDRDFSNALHQLRMRRYNILLAQPQQASAALVKAAKSVWLWTSLVAGGPHLSENELQKLGKASHNATSEPLRTPTLDTIKSTLPTDFHTENTHFGNQSSSCAARPHETKQKGKATRKNPNQTNGPRPSNTPFWTQENQHNLNPQQPSPPGIPKVFASGPAPNMVPGNSNCTWSDITNVPANNHNQFLQPLRPNDISATKPDFTSTSSYPPNHHASTSSPMIPARPSGTGFTMVPGSDMLHVDNSFPNAPLADMPEAGNLGLSGYPGSFNNSNHHTYNPTWPTGAGFAHSPPPNVPDVGNLNNPGYSGSFSHHNNQTFTPTTMPARPSGAGFTPAPLVNMPDVGDSFISGSSGSSNNPPTAQRQGGEAKNEPKKKPHKPVSLSKSPSRRMKRNSQSSHHVPTNNMKSHVGSDYPPSSTMAGSLEPGNNAWGTPGRLDPSQYVQGLIGVIILALDTLKNEKISPTEANIADCIRYGDPKHPNVDVEKALKSAIEQKMVVKQRVGSLDLYVRKKEQMWKCINLVGGNAKEYPKGTWDEIEKFLTSPPGRSALLASQCRYEAGTILKNMCLKELGLGNILKILELMISTKKWIIPHQSGWQPLNITLAKLNNDPGSTSSA